MIVSVSASTTQGTEMTQQELATVFEACDVVSHSSGHIYADCIQFFAFCSVCIIFASH